MNMLKNLDFNEVIDINTLQNIQDKFAKITHIAAITVDIDGNPAAELSNFTPFCKLIRSSPKGLKQCRLCDAQGGFKAMQTKKPAIYTCHTGLTDLAAPIIVNNFFLGSILGGQVLIKGKYIKDSIDLKKISKEYNLPLDALEKAFEYTPLVEYEYLQNSVDFLNLIASHIAQIGINRLTQEQLLMESQEKIKFQEEAKTMQLKTLQAQINPHFLFNTLNTIARMALIEDAPNTEELIYKLSDLLRYNLRNLEELPKIKSEISNIEKYLFIQTLRYSDRISYEINISEAIKDCRIPTMTLQPIVENCIVHGLETKKEGGKITIKGNAISQKDIIIEISDNGTGMNSCTLNLLNHMKNISNNDLGLGIQNTHNRIKHYFGESYGLKIESTPTTGTTVYIHIPYTK